MADNTFKTGCFGIAAYYLLFNLLPGYFLFKPGYYFQMNASYNNILYLLRFLKDAIYLRLQNHFDKNDSTPAFSVSELHLPFPDGALYQFWQQYPCLPEEYIVLVLALTPHLQPNFIYNMVQQYLPGGGDFTEIGGVKSGNHRGMMPTGETALFILAGTDVQRRMEIQQMLFDSRLLKEGLMILEPVKDGEPVMSGRLLVAQEWMDKIVFDRENSPSFGTDFPAKKISTAMTWDDLVLNNHTQHQLDDLMIWVQHNETVMQDKALQRKIKPGYRVLFYGPSGTGKTLTATLIGNQFGKEVYRIDISQMVSKYIGETEKNLEKVFSKAENKNWILFFDEADALFGKRTNVQSSHDRYANQEVSYLLQRIEDYPGLIILASNFKSNMDDAFLRRFHSIIHFPSPKGPDRLKLWQKTMPSKWQPEPSINLAELSEKYDLNGAAILNVVQAATLQSASRQDAFIRQADLLEAIRKEYRKEDRSII